MRQVFPQPGFTDTDIHQLLATGQFMFADAFTIEPIYGDPLLYTNFQQDVTLVPVYEDAIRKTFLCRVLNIEGLRMVSSVGIQVDEQDIVLNYNPDPLGFQNRISWPKAVLYGLLDGAVIRRDRYIKAEPNQPWIGGWTMFRGRVSAINNVGRSSATIRVKSNLIVMDTQMPRDFYEPNCKNTLYDPNCGIDRADFMVTGNMGPNPTRSVIPWSASEEGYSLGTLHVSTGDDTVRVRTILRATSSELYLAYPLDFDPVEGQVFQAYLGCNRTTERCQFFHGTNWPNRFKGFPFVPVAETAVGIGITGGQG